jgi:hypothetical protein
VLADNRRGTANRKLGAAVCERVSAKHAPRGTPRSEQGAQKAQAERDAVNEALERELLF